MAGSYNHIIGDNGEFIGVDLIDNLRDAYEALEECYGMIWLLADGNKELVEEAASNYKLGLRYAPKEIKQ